MANRFLSAMVGAGSLVQNQLQHNDKMAQLDADRILKQQLADREAELQARSLTNTERLTKLKEDELAYREKSDVADRELQAERTAIYKRTIDLQDEQYRRKVSQEDQAQHRADLITAYQYIDNQAYRSGKSAKEFLASDDGKQAFNGLLNNGIVKSQIASAIPGLEDPGLIRGYQRTNDGLMVMSQKDGKQVPLKNDDGTAYVIPMNQVLPMISMAAAIAGVEDSSDVAAALQQYGASGKGDGKPGLTVREVLNMDLSPPNEDYLAGQAQGYTDSPGGIKAANYAPGAQPKNRHEEDAQRIAGQHYADKHGTLTRAKAAIEDRLTKGGLTARQQTDLTSRLEGIGQEIADIESRFTPEVAGQYNDTKTASIVGDAVNDMGPKITAPVFKQIERSTENIRPTQRNLQPAKDLAEGKPTRPDQALRGLILAQRSLGTKFTPEQLSNWSNGDFRSDRDMEMIKAQLDAANALATAKAKGRGDATKANQKLYDDLIKANASIIAGTTDVARYGIDPKLSFTQQVDVLSGMLNEKFRANAISSSQMGVDVNDLGNARPVDIVNALSVNREDFFRTDVQGKGIFDVSDPTDTRFSSTQPPARGNYVSSKIAEWEATPEGRDRLARFNEVARQKGVSLEALIEANIPKG